VTMEWIYTKYTNTQGPTARRRALSQCGSEQLQRAPSIGTADGVGDKIDPHVRVRASHTSSFNVRILYHHSSILTTTAPVCQGPRGGHSGRRTAPTSGSRRGKGVNTPKRCSEMYLRYCAPRLVACPSQCQSILLQGTCWGLFENPFFGSSPHPLSYLYPQYRRCGGWEGCKGKRVMLASEGVPGQPTVSTIRGLQAILSR